MAPITVIVSTTTMVTATTRATMISMEVSIPDKIKRFKHSSMRMHVNKDIMQHHVTLSRLIRISDLYYSTFRLCSKVGQTWMQFGLFNV
jgi:hypothetical protein